ncbi:MAG: hypothetical protein ACFB0C_11120 [Leptolyngbyaceae cyanobacterium]
MAYWEFLLQQDGDLTWLPLETAHVEIREGRYRIVAHTSHSETPIEIHLTQVLAQQMPPKQRRLKRQGQTNAEGLMVVMPFTHLTAGTWTIRCVATAEGDNTEALAYGVQLRVVPVEADPESWAPDWDIPEEEPLPEPLQVLHQLGSVEPRQRSPETSVASSKADMPVPGLQPCETFPDLDAQSLGDLPLRLRLEQQAFMAQAQQPITLAGEVIDVGNQPALPGSGTLGVQLRDPAQGKVVARWSRSLSWPRLPAVFEVTMPLPEAADTRLLVGEMSLWQGTMPAPQVMAIQGFTVTTNLAQLLETVTQKGEVAFQEDASKGDGDEVWAGEAPNSERDDSPEVPIRTMPLAMPAVRDVPFRLIYLPASGLTLPPQIQSIPLSDSGPRRLDLPTLPNQPTRPASAPASSPARSLELPLISAPAAPQDSSSAADLPGSAADSEEPEGRSLELPTLGRIPQPDGRQAADSTNRAGTESEPAVLDEPISEVPSLVPDAQFTDLNLKDRFWGRLSALAHEGQSAAAELKRQMEAAGVESEPNSDPTLPELDVPESEPVLPTMTVAAPSHEVVVYDDVPVPAPVDRSDQDRSDADEAQPVETLIVPVPQVNLPNIPLVAGSPLTLTVSLSSFPHRLAVKFWMTDIQNRSLVEKPRWLMNWTPTGQGQLEALLHLQVPMGCLEVRFEAIAIDLATQEESHKATLQRPIISSQGGIIPLGD